MLVPVLPILFAVALNPATAHSPAPQSAVVARAVIREAQLAVEGDSVARVRARWLRTASAARPDPRIALGLATLARLTYAYADADARYLALERQDHSRAGKTTHYGLYALLGRGASQAARWRTDSAVVLYTRALEAARTLADSLAEAEARLGLARIRGRTVGFDSAVRLLTPALASIPAHEKALLANVRCGLALLQAHSNATRADSAVDVALRLAEASGELRAQGSCLSIQAVVREIRGHQVRARESAVAAAKVLRQARDHDALASILQFLAYHTVTYSTDFAVSRQFADSAIVTGLRAGNPLAVAWAQLNLAQLALRFGDARATARLTQAASAQFQALGDQYGMGTASFLRGDAAYLTGRLDDAQLAYLRADSLHARLRNAGARPVTLLRVAGVLRELGRPREAHRTLDEAVRLAKAMGFAGLANTDQHYERGMLALDARDYAMAIREFEAFRTKLGNAQHLHYDAQARIAEALTGLGRLTAAESVLVQLDQTAEHLRRVGSERAAHVAALDSRRFDYDTDLGFATIVQRMHEEGRVGAAFRIAENRRARYLWTALLRRNALRDDGGKLLSARYERMLPAPDIDIPQLQAALPDSTALVEFVTGRGGEPSTVFVVSRRGSAAITLPAADSLVDDIATLVAALEAGAAPRAAARSLGAALLGPALNTLGPDVTRLVIVPDGPFYRVPFDALERAGRPLLARYTISLAPSARIALAMWRARPQARAGRLLALGDPAFAPAAKQPRLPGSGREARAIARGVPRAQVLLGAQAGESALTQTDLSDVRVLHLATHAVVEDFGLLRSSLLLAPGNGEDGRLGVADIAALELNADLVVLSGCRTAGGVVVTGEGIQGLVGPFLEAGARTVVATQWPVGDRSIGPIMTRFYRGMRAGLTAGDALRAAKLAAQQAGQPASVWAALVLTGDARVRPLAGESGARADASRR